MINRITEQKKLLKQSLQNISKRMNNLPAGRVSFRKKEGYYYIAKRTGGARQNQPLKDQYVSLKHPDSSALATKFYLEKLAALLHKELDVLEKFETDYHPEEKYELLTAIPNEIRPLVRNPLQTTEEKAFQWANSSYARNTMDFNESSSYYTLNKERVRSRAEVIIADILYNLKVPYRYEAAFTLGYNVVYPDFTVMSPITGEVFYIEYFGLMDFEEYRLNAFNKIKEYGKTDVAGNFIFFFECDGVSMDTPSIENTIIKKLHLDKIS